MDGKAHATVCCGSAALCPVHPMMDHRDQALDLMEAFHGARCTSARVLCVARQRICALLHHMHHLCHVSTG
jgi:hypothetical protein